MPIPSENDQLIVDYHRHVAVPRTWLLPHHDVGVVMQRLEELGVGFLAEVSQPVLLLHLWVGITNHVQRVLHGLGGSLQDDQLLLVLLGNLKVFQHLRLLLVEHLLPLLVQHLARTLRAFVDGLVHPVCSYGKLVFGCTRSRTVHLVQPDAYSLQEGFLSAAVLLQALVLVGLAGLRVRHALLLDLPWRLLFQRGPFVGLSGEGSTLRS